jgi:hypothetical protein
MTTERGHFPFAGPHWTLYELHQMPSPKCECFWVKLGVGQGPVPPNAQLFPSNRKTMTDPQNLPTTYGYDVLNRLSSLAFNDSHLRSALFMMRSADGPV